MHFTRSRKVLDTALAPFKKYAIGLTAVMIAAVYAVRIPSTVQGGDTGELISAAWGFFVPHPPGYPFFLWLQSVFIHLFPMGTVFQRAAFLNVLFSVVVLYFLGLLLRQNKAFAVASMLLLAFSRIYWKYSLLPDVFILNALFAGLCLFLYCKDHSNSRHVVWLPFLFCAGLTNHLTLIFLAPLVLHILWKYRKQKAVYLSLALGIFFFVGAYASLGLLQPGHFHSWGRIDDVSSLVEHFLRKDYGTFQLVNSLESGSAPAIWRFFAEENLSAFWSLLVVVGGLGIKSKIHEQARNPKVYLLALCLMLYPVVFFSLSNTDLAGFRSEVVERFFILFQVTFVFCAAALTVHWSSALSKRAAQLTAALLMVGAIGNFGAFQKVLWFSENTVIEDYAVNMLRQAPATPTVVLVQSDTRFFALRYAQTVLGVRPDVTVVASKLLFFPWFAEKLVAQTGLKLDLEKLKRTQAMALEEDLVLPNLAKFSFLSTFEFKNAQAYHIKYCPLGRLLSAGSGVSFANGNEALSPYRSSGAALPSSAQKYDVGRDLWSDYCFYPLMLSSALAGQKNSKAATELPHRTVDLIPWCLPAVRGLCLLKSGSPTVETPSCKQEVESTAARYYPYFRP